MQKAGRLKHSSWRNCSLAIDVCIAGNGYILNSTSGHFITNKQFTAVTLFKMKRVVIASQPGLHPGLGLSTRYGAPTSIVLPTTLTNRAEGANIKPLQYFLSF